MTRDELVDAVLNELSKKEYVNIQVGNYLVNTLNVDINCAYSITSFLEDEDLVVGAATSYYRISKYGRTVVEKGGWIKYLKKIEEVERRREQKEIHDAGLSQWLYKSRWWPLGISALALIASLIALFS